MFDAYTSLLWAYIITFCKVALSGSHPRGDCEEFLNISLIFLGGAEGEAVSFRSPGAYHHAMWMTTAIYCIKIYLFQQQFALTDKEKWSVTELVLFASLVYVRFWLILLVKSTLEILVGLPLFDERIAADVKRVKREMVRNLQVAKSSKSLLYTDRKSVV